MILPLHERAQGLANALHCRMLALQLDAGHLTKSAGHEGLSICGLQMPIGMPALAGLHDWVSSLEPHICRAAKGLAFEARSLMVSGVIFLPFLTSFSRAGRSSLRSAAFARLHPMEASPRICTSPVV